jgi:hypothetical protein
MQRTRREGSLKIAHASFIAPDLRLPVTAAWESLSSIAAHHRMELTFRSPPKRFAARQSIEVPEGRALSFLW